ncbi:substrate-binding domain-containing protein [Ensifer sp. ENS08]|nr:substrate-binding domain-containing protein [Ensifer sp. ENS08]
MSIFTRRVSLDAIFNNLPVPLVLLPYDGRLVAEGNWTPTSGYEAMRKLLSLEQPPTAVFCQNDKMAMGCFDAIREFGLRVREDISVMGYDDDELSRHLRPQLTTLELPHCAMGTWAIGQLAKKPSGHSRAVHKVTCTLIERASSVRLS